MAQMKFSEMSLDELKGKEKTFKNIGRALIAIVAMLFGCGIFLTIIKGFNVFTVLPIAFLSIMITNQASLKSLRAEIKSRES